MRVISYVHPIRTYLPCTGVGRHINQILLGLNQKEEINLQLLFSQQWLGEDGKLPSNCPLREIPSITFPRAENATERSWKLLGYPSMDKYLPHDVDWLYAPMETYIPVSKCPVAVTIHDIQAFENNLPWSNTWQHRWFAYKWGKWIKKALRDCRIVFTVSEFSKGRMVKLLGADADKIVVVGNGVDRTFFDIKAIDRETLKPPINLPYTVIIGGLKKKKGADYVLSVAQELKKIKSNLQIVVAGTNEVEYEQKVKNLDNIHILGLVSDDDLPSLVRCASSLLFLSLYEGFGIPVLEAMATGTPVIVSNCASLPEIVDTAGIILNPENTQEICDSLIQIEKNTQLREYYSQVGQERAKTYTWSKYVDLVQKALYSYS